MKLIDADELKKKIKRCDDSATRATFDYVDEDDIDDAPTVCDIEQIRAEIERLHYHPKLDFIKNDEVVDMVLDIIDKYKS